MTYHAHWRDYARQMQNAPRWLNGALIMHADGSQEVVPHVAADLGVAGGDYTAVCASRRITGQRADWIMIDDIHVADEKNARDFALKIYDQWLKKEGPEMCDQSDCKCEKPAEQPDPTEFADRKLCKAQPFGVVTQTVKTWKPSSSWVKERRYLNTGVKTFASRKEANAYAKAKSQEYPEVAFMVVVLSDIYATVPPPARLTHTKVRAR